MKHTLKILSVAALMAVILVTSMSPAMARRQAGGILMPTTRPCEVHSETNNDEVPQFEFRDTPAPNSCWKVLPDQAG